MCCYTFEKSGRNVAQEGWPEPDGRVWVISVEADGIATSLNLPDEQSTKDAYEWLRQHPEIKVGPRKRI